MPEKIIGWKGKGMKILYDDIISTVDDFFEKWDPSTATLIEKMCRPQKDYVEK